MVPTSFSYVSIWRSIVNNYFLFGRNYKQENASCIMLKNTSLLNICNYKGENITTGYLVNLKTTGYKGENITTGYLVNLKKKMFNN